MTGDNMGRTFQRLIEWHERMQTDFERLKRAQDRTAAQIESLAEIISRLNKRTRPDSYTRGRSQILTEDMRCRLDRLILSDEVTRELYKQIARLTIDYPDK